MIIFMRNPCSDPAGNRESGLHIHEKSEVATSFLKNTGTDPPWEAIGPLGSNRFFGRSVRPSVKYVDD